MKSTWYNMGAKPLAYDVREPHGKIAIPAGTKYVSIKFRASHIKYKDPKTGKWTNLNIYYWKQPGKPAIIVHGC